MLKLSDVNSLATDSYEVVNYDTLSIERISRTLDEYVVVDPFGNIIRTGDATSVVKYVNEFISITSGHCE